MLVVELGSEPGIPLTPPTPGVLAKAQERLPGLSEAFAWEMDGTAWWGL